MKWQFIVMIVMLTVISTACMHNVPTNKPLCTDPYVWNGTSCCADLNNNAQCDSTENSIDILDDTCSALDYKVMNVCSIGSSVRYVIKIGPEQIDSFTFRVKYTPSEGGKEKIETFTITGGDANTIIKGQVTLPPGIYRQTVLISDTCDVQKIYGQEFPGILQSC